MVSCGALVGHVWPHVLAVVHVTSRLSLPRGGNVNLAYVNGSPDRGWSGVLAAGDDPFLSTRILAGRPRDVYASTGGR